jgi:hypothetical protein
MIIIAHYSPLCVLAFGACVWVYEGVHLWSAFACCLFRMVSSFLVSHWSHLHLVLVIVYSLVSLPSFFLVSRHDCSRVGARCGIIVCLAVRSVRYSRRYDMLCVLAFERVLNA